MNNMAYDLSGLVPFLYAFVAVAVLAGVVSLAVIGRAAGAFVITNHRARLARRENIPTYYRRLILH